MSFVFVSYQTVCRKACVYMEVHHQGTSVPLDVAIQFLSAIDHHLGSDDILLEILTVYDLKLKIKLFEMAILLSSWL